MSLYCQYRRPAGKYMKKLIIILSVSLLSWFGWWLGVRFGLMTGYLLSFVGSLIGVYAGVLINREYMS
jgi:hypothetical protein